MTRTPETRARHGERLRRDYDADYARSLMAAAAREREATAWLMAGAKIGDITADEVWSNLGPSRRQPPARRHLRSRRLEPDAGQLRVLRA
ncbi:MAG: hypothetical protein AMXMBFR59_11830 [Rhodanobacteraceae bacterium]